MRNGITLILTLAIFCFSGFNIYNLYNIKERAFESIDSARQYMENDGFSEAAQICDELFEKWQRDEKIMKLFCRRNHVDEAADTLAELSSYAENKNKAMFMAASEKAKNRIEHIWTSEIPSFDSLM